MSELLGGGCHCGRVRFRVRVDAFEALDCTCSVCTMKGFVHLVVEKGAFELLARDGVLSTIR